MSDISARAAAEGRNEGTTSGSRFGVGVAAASIAGFAVAWWILTWVANHLYAPPPTHGSVGTYARLAHAMIAGRVPYLGFELEYPPLAIPAFVIPAVLVGTTEFSAYRAAFEAEMLACGAAMCGLAVVTLSRLGVSRSRLLATAGLVAVSPLLIGPVILARFDLWPALLTTSALTATIAGRLRLGSLALGLAIAAKVYPIVIVPVIVVAIWRWRGRREAIVNLAITVGVVALVVVPFAVLAPRGVLTAVLRTVERPLQVESLGASILYVAHSMTGLPLTVVSSFGSQNLVGPLPAAIAIVTAALMALSLIFVWARLATRAMDRHELLVGCAAAVAAFVVFGKVLSPQYLIWLIPIVAMVGGRRGFGGSALFVVALLFTAWYFPDRWAAYTYAFDPRVALVVFVRNGALLALFFVLAYHGSASNRSRSGGEPDSGRAPASS